MQAPAVSESCGEGHVVVRVSGGEGDDGDVVARQLRAGLVRQLCAERQAPRDRAEEVRHCHAGAVDEVRVAQRERGREEVALVVSRELGGLPLALLDLRDGLGAHAVGEGVDDVGVEVAGGVHVRQKEREGLGRAQHLGANVGGAEAVPARLGRAQGQGVGHLEVVAQALRTEMD